MPYFLYKAKDRQGQLISGTLESENRSSVVARLHVMGYFPIEISGEEQDKGKGLEGAIRQVRRFGGGVKSRDLTMFYRQMSDLVGAGVPLVKSLGIVKSQCTNDNLKNLLSQVDQDVQGGDTFARALDRHPKVFNKLTTAMVHAGETGGLLEETLSRLADFAETEEELKGRIVSAMVYPAVMLFAGGLALGVLFVVVIPKIVGVFEELNQTLPMITQVLIVFSAFMGSYWYFLLGGAVASGFFLKRYIASEAGAHRFHELLLRTPVMGEVILKREVARFTRTLGSLLRNGVPILSSLEISGEVLTNVLIKEEIAKVPEGISQGGGMAATLRGSAFFPPVVVNMIAIGEETGNLPEILLKVATTYEGQVDRAVKVLTALLENVIILVMGLLVGFIVIAMMLPIFELDPTGGQ